MDHKLEINDDIKSNDKAGSADVSLTAPEKQEYTVISKAGLFKNGKQYDAGEKILLNAKTAANFLASGDIEE